MEKLLFVSVGIVIEAKCVCCIPGGDRYERGDFDVEDAIGRGKGGRGRT